MLMLKRFFIVAAIIALFSAPALSQDFPSKPMELVCTTRPGSSVAAWCQLLGQEFPKVLGVPMRVTFKSGGSQHEPVLYVEGKPADGHTVMHSSASFYGYFHLPHYKRNYQDHFESLAQVEQHIYGVALLRDNKYGIKTYEDFVAYAKKNPGKLAIGTNKMGSTHHRHQLAFLKAAGIGDAVRTVFYKGDGNVVKDVIGGHLPVGQASPRTWRAHIEAGTVIPLVIQSPTRLSTDKNWKDVRTVLEVGLKYDLPIHWQGLMLKKGTPPATRAKLVDALNKITSGPVYQDYLANGTHIVPNLKTDRDYLNEDMAKNQVVVKEFMIEYKIIKE